MYNVLQYVAHSSHLIYPGKEPIAIGAGLRVKVLYKLAHCTGYSSFTDKNRYIIHGLKICLIECNLKPQFKICNIFKFQVDVAYAPFVERFHPLALDVKQYDITTGRPKLALWIEELNKIEGYKQTKRDPQELVAILKKHILGL